MKKYFTSVPVALLSFGSAASVFAQESPAVTPADPTLVSLVNAANVQQSILTQLVPWLEIGLGVGLSLLVVYIGWRLFRRFAK